MSTIITPEIAVPQGGASLMVAFRCTKKNVLVVGYDEIAANRILSALEADANVTLVSPTQLMCNDLLYRIKEGQIDWLGSEFEEEQLIGNHLVFVTRLDDMELCQRISNSCWARRIPVNVANHKELSDFDMTCTYRDQSLQVAVSTNGLSSVNLANRILQTKISSSLSPHLGEAVRNVGLLRKRLEMIHPGSSKNVARYQWLSRICEHSRLDRLATLTNSDIDALLLTFDSSHEKREEPSSSLISFIVASDSQSLMNDRVKQMLDSANLVIVDQDVLQTGKNEALIATSKVVQTPERSEDLNNISLQALEEGKRVARLVSSINNKSDSEITFYQYHGYIPLMFNATLATGDTCRAQSDTLKPIIIV